MDMDRHTSSLSRRQFLRLAGLTAAGSFLTACSLRPAQPGASSGPVQLVYQDWRTEWFPALAQEMLTQFNNAHPNIRVFYTPDPENLEEKMLADMAAGTAPDIITGCCEFFQSWADAGYLLDLRPYVEADLDQETIDDWNPAQYGALITRAGIQYALPKYHGALALFYNKDLFDASQVEYPTENWTYDDYLEAMRRLTIQEGGVTRQWGSMFDVTWDRIQIHVNGFGGHFVNQEDPRRCDMASPASLEALEWLRARMWDDRVMPTFLDVQNMETREAFIAQKIAMVEDGSWALKDILENASFRVGVAPFPAGPKRRATLGTTDGYGIFADTKHPDEAWEFLKFLVSKDYGRAMAQAHFLQPARTSLIPEWVEYIQTEYPEKSKEVDIAAFAHGQIHGYSVTAESFPNMVGVVKVAQDAWDGIYTLGNTPVSEMKEVCQRIEAIQQGSAQNQEPIPCDCEGSG
jgi:multiple sugar transport system substrate-binding protein